MSTQTLAVFSSHPVQYQAPLFKKLAAQPGLDLRAYYYCRQGLDRSFDPQFGRTFKWDLPLLQGYEAVFLRNVSPMSGFHFFGFINPGVSAALRTGHFDAALITSWSYLSDWLVVLAAWRTRTPLWLRCENPFNQEQFKPKWKRWLKRILLAKLLFPHINAFLAIGEENRKFLLAYGAPATKIFSTPYAVDNERFSAEAQRLKLKRTELRQGLGLDSDDIVVLFVGKLIQKKRPLDLLRAYDLVASDRKALVFVGDGNLRASLEQFVAEHKLARVHFVGFKNQTELPPYYALADLLVLPSEAGETWGLVVNEAMCFRLPVIVSNVVGCGPDLVHQNENGFIVPLGNQQVLAQALEILVSNTDQRERFGAKSFERIQHYSYGADIAGIREAFGQTTPVK